MKWHYKYDDLYAGVGHLLIPRTASPFEPLCVGNVSPLTHRNDQDCSARNPFFYNDSWSYLPENYQVLPV